jgi:putative 2OG-Fe(II) oxygenase
MPSLDQLKAEAEREGFIAFRDFFPGLAKQAHDELDAWFEIDLESRRTSGEKSNYHNGAAGRSVLSPSMHILQDVFGKSPTLDRMFEKALTDANAGGLIHHLAGKNLKLRGYNVRRMTGVANNSGMEWHRDNPGEIGWSLLLTDTGPGIDGSTCVVRGSHLYPYCVRKNLLLPWSYYPGFRIFQRFNLFSLLAKRRYVDGKSASASGRAGDFYVFINDLWHGRENNLGGKNTMVFLASVFPTEVGFPDDVPIPSDEVLATLPPVLRKIVDYRQTPVNSDTSAYVHRMIEQRQKVGTFTLWRFGQLERRIVDVLSLPKVWLLKRVITPAYQWLRGFPLFGPMLRQVARKLRPAG